MEKTLNGPENKRGWKQYRAVWSRSLSKKQVGLLSPKYPAELYCGQKWQRGCRGAGAVEHSKVQLEHNFSQSGGCSEEGRIFNF